MKMMVVSALLIASASLASATDMGMLDKMSLMQLRVDVASTNTSQQDLVFFHVPMNFGNSIALTAAVGSGSSLTYGEVTQAAQKGWDNVNAMTKPGAPVWGPVNPDLQVKSEISGYPMYYTPPNLWPESLAEAYFGNKTVFGLLRDPYERITALFRGRMGTARGFEYNPDGRNCAAEVSEFVKQSLSTLVQHPELKFPGANLQPQADYFEGPHGITVPLDLDEFPADANSLFKKHGYDINIQLNDMMHVHGCDDTWSGDMDEEAKSLVRKYYARDFELRCKYFGYCDDQVYHCLPQVPGMCPTSLFAWSEESSYYIKK